MTVETAERVELQEHLIEDLFVLERDYLDYFFSHLDYKAIEAVAKVVLTCPGTIFLTGVGKSGVIAKKIALTLMSTGTKSLYLSPTDALHGDLGIVSQDDLLLILSKSGESDELFHLIPCLHHRGATLIAVVSNPASRLAKSCHHVVHLPLKQELCPFGLAPTTSTVEQLLFGDVLAVALMRSKRFSLDQYVLNHPGGRIGKRLTVRVSDLMLKGREIPLCHPQDKLIEVLVELSDKRCGCVLVVDSQQSLQGIFTDGDLRRALQSFGPSALNEAMQGIMTRHPRTVAADKLAVEAVQLMEADRNHPIMVLPVLEADNKVVGLIKMHDIVQSGL